MGYMRHHGIMVTGMDLTALGEPDRLSAAHARAVELFPIGTVSSLGGKVLNGHRSFSVFPDGSKEGWAESEEGDARRAAFKGYLREIGAGSYLDWVEVQYGDDGGETKVTDDSER